MPTTDQPYSQWCPPELTAAAEPLRRVGRVLLSLAEDHRGLERLGDSAPDVEVRAALTDFVERWELALWSVGGRADDLGHALERAAQDYRGSEDDLARRLADRTLQRVGRLR